MTLRSQACEPADHLWVRVAKPDWKDPLDASFAGTHGGRWNPPRSWPTLYLNRDLDTARAQVMRDALEQRVRCGEVREALRKVDSVAVIRQLRHDREYRRPEARELAAARLHRDLQDYLSSAAK